MTDDEDHYVVEGLKPSDKIGALTEREILACLKENLRLAAENAFKLAAGERGLTYLSFRQQIDLVYGCCRQMGGWREDTRWSAFAPKIKEVQERCRRWLTEKQPGWRFKSVGEILVYALKQAEDLETKKTGHRGIILPKSLPAPSRTQGRQILVPAGYADIRNRETTH